jgi:hypothetical protein
MARLLYVRVTYVRVTGAVVLCSLAFLLVSLDPFLRAAPIGPGVGGQTPAVSVNRFRKGDLLPIHRPGALRQNFRRPDGLQTQRHVPFGCDPAFSPVATPSLSEVFGRCMA